MSRASTNGSSPNGWTSGRAASASPRARTLAEGANVEASVVARLFGVRVLRLNASVVITPASVTRRTPEVGRGLHEASRRLATSADSLEGLRHRDS